MAPGMPPRIPLARQQQVYRARRKRASEIAQIVKDVYHDLLTSTDKILQGRASNQPFGYTRAQAATTKNPEYQGLLAVAADDVSNTIWRVSATRDNISMK